MSETAADKIARLQEFNDRLLNLFWFTAQISTERSPDTLHQIVVNGLSLVTGIEKCSMYLMETGVGPYEVATSGQVTDDDSQPTVLMVAKLYNLVLERKAGIEVMRSPILGEYDAVLVCPLENSRGEVQGMLCGFTTDDYAISEDYQSMLDLYVNQVSLTLENIELNRKLRRYAFIDPLTGLYNRRHFYRRLRSELNRAQRNNNPVTLLMLDLDDFKQYNDRFGHIAGDRALKQMGALLKSSLRAMDMIVRFGGEEFTVILPETSLKDGLTVADHLRSAIERTPFAGRHMTVSIGVACYPDHALKAHQLIEVSDRAMYIAKRLGRNRVSTINAPSPLSP